MLHDRVPFNNYVDKMRGGGRGKAVHAQGIKTVHAGRGQKMANVHVVVE